VDIGSTLFCCWRGADAMTNEELLRHGTVEIIIERELRAALESG
jgi:hypothetical protein